MNVKNGISHAQVEEIMNDVRSALLISTKSPEPRHTLIVAGEKQYFVSALTGKYTCWVNYQNDLPGRLLLRAPCLWHFQYHGHSLDFNQVKTSYFSACNLTYTTSTVHQVENGGWCMVENGLLTDIRLTTILPFFTVTQSCCPRGKSLSSIILEDQFASPCSCSCHRNWSPWPQHWHQL